MYGYVHTMADVAAHKARPLADVINEVNNWYDNFGSYLLGIFFDEVDGAATNVSQIMFLIGVLYITLLMPSHAISSVAARQPPLLNPVPHLLLQE